jgi:hypothetical protein
MAARPDETAYALRGGLGLLGTDGFLTDFKSSASLRSLSRVEVISRVPFL